MKRTLILLVITLLVAGWVYWMEVREDTRLRDTEEREQASKTLLGVTSGRDISSFTLERDGAETITVRRVGEEWQLTSPVATRAEESTVKEVLWDLEFIEKERTIEESTVTDELLKEYGIEEPLGRVEVETITGVKRFVVGGEAPGGENVYVRQDDGGPVYLVKKDFAEMLDKTVYQMRNKTVIALVPTQVGAIRIFGPTSRAALMKKDDGWNLVEPFEDYADPETVNRFLENAMRLKVVSFVSDAPESYEEYGLPDPYAPHVIEKGRYISVGEGASAGKQRIVHFGDRAPDENGAKVVYALVKDESAVFTLPSELAESLFVRVPDLQARKMIRIDPYALKRVTVSHQLEQVEFAKRDFDWYIVKPYEAPADSGAVRDLLSVFSSAVMTEFITPEPVLERYGLDVPKGSFSFVEGESQARGLIFGDEAEDGGVYVTRTDTPGVFRASLALYEKLSKPPLDYHTREMQKISMDQASAITITRADGEFRLEPEGRLSGISDWKLAAPAEAPSNPLVVSKIVLGLATTTALELVERLPVDLGVYGLAEPDIKVAVAMGEGLEQPKALLVGAVTSESSRYAMFEGGEIVFTIGSDFASALGRELREAAVFDFRRGAATRVEFLAGGEKYVALKTDNEWSAESPEGFSVASAAIEDELLHLLRLEAERFVTYATGDLARYGLLKPRAVVRVEAQGRIAALSVGDMHERGYYYATSNTVEGVFLLDPGDMINVLDPERLFDRPAIGADEPAGAPEEGGPE